MRWVLLILLADAKCPLTVAELVRRIEGGGGSIHGRPSKAVSDGLRWEIRRGRVQRVARATYAIDYLARSTEWWIRQRVNELLDAEVVQPLSDNAAALPEWFGIVARRLDNTNDVETSLGGSPPSG